MGEEGEVEENSEDDDEGEEEEEEPYFTEDQPYKEATEKLKGLRAGGEKEGVGVSNVGRRAISKQIVQSLNPVCTATSAVMKVILHGLAPNLSSGLQPGWSRKM